MDPPQSSGSRPRAAQKDGLLRIVGIGFGLAVVVGGMIEIGILRTPGVVAAQLATPWMMIAVWVFGGIYALAGANTFSELGTMLPRAGGPYVYAQRAYGLYGGFLVGWSDWLLNASLTAYLAVAFSEYVALLFPALGAGGITAAPAASPAVALGTISVLALLNWVGLRMGSTIQKLMSLLKAVAFLFIIIACFAFGGSQELSGALHQPATPLAAGPVALFIAIVLATQVVLETYAGWYNPVYFTEEDTDPARNIPRAMFGGIFAVMIIYVLFNLVLLYVLPVSRLAASKLPAADAAQAVFGGFSDQLITVLALVSLLGILNLQVLSAPRILFSLGRDGLFAARVATVNAGGTPIVALFLTTLVAMFLAASGTFESLLSTTAFMALSVECAVYAALFILRRRAPDLPRPYRARGYPYVPLLVLVGSLLLLIGYCIGNTANSAFALTAMALSYPAYLYVRRKAYRPSP